jgi:hypothetical protein
MRMTRRSVVTIALAVASAMFCSGCPALMIPGLAYSGYKYEHEKNQRAASASSTQSSKSTTPSQQQQIPDSDIE